VPIRGIWVPIRAALGDRPPSRVRHMRFAADEHPITRG